MERYDFGAQEPVGAVMQDCQLKLGVRVAIELLHHLLPQASVTAKNVPEHASLQNFVDTV